MNKQIHFGAALLTSLIAGAVFAAGTEAFSLLPENVANMAGMVVGGLAAVLWATYGMYQGESKSE
ncbi:MAG: hypothetical protein AAF458_02090 [Pseudomonadota bacterium]